MNKQVNITDLYIDYSRINPPFSYHMHFHNLHEIIYIIDGSAKFIISDKEYIAEKNSLLFINSLESHSSEIIKFPYCRYYILIPSNYLRTYINDPLLLSIFKPNPNKTTHMINLNDTTNIKVATYFQTMYYEFNHKKKYYTNMIGNTLNPLFIDLYRSYKNYFLYDIPSNTLQLINKIENYIETNFTENINLHEIASDNNIDMYYLSKLFKHVTGLGYKEYLISQRISYAKQMLISTNATITEVCICSGFNNINHFIRIFKNRENTTPLQFRKNYKKF